MTPAVNSPAEIPLSYPQQLLRFVEMLRPGSATGAAFNVVALYRLSGPLELEALGWAAEAVVGRHDALRTVIVQGPGVPHQRVLPVAAAPLDVTEAEPGERESEAVATFFNRLAATQFDVSRPPLLRAAVRRLGRDDHLLGVAGHHSVLDDWSQALLLRDLAALYVARITGGVPPPRPCQYAELARRQELEADARPMARGLAYWQRQLDGLDARFLPAGRRRADTGTGPKETRCLELGAGVARALLGRARAERTTPFLLLLTAYVKALGECTGSNDATVPVLVSGRDEPWADGVVGFFLNALLVRVGVDPDAGGSALIRAVRDAGLRAFAHRHVPIIRVIEHVADVAIALADPDAVVVPFQLLDLPVHLRTSAFGRAACTQVLPPGGGRTPAGMTLPLDGLVTAQFADDGRLVVDIVFRADLYDARSIEAFAAALESALDELAQSPAPR
jgi:Condensation domain